MTPRLPFSLPLPVACLVFLCACQGAPSASSAELARAADLATQFRDQWLAENPSDEAATLARGEIFAMQRQGPPSYREWHVTFVTETGHDQPEGIHDYYLHVHLVLTDEGARLMRVERGPDLLS